MSFAATWEELEGFMLSEISQAHKDEYFMFSLICGSSKVDLREVNSRMVVPTASEEYRRVREERELEEWG